MTKNKKNLKFLFLFNAILLALASVLIQYSVVSHENSNPELAGVSSEKTSLKQASDDFDQRLVRFDPPLAFKNIEFHTALDKSLSLEDLKGQWIVLNFWASWCPPCVAEMPSLQMLQDSYGNAGVQVIAIGLDRNMDGAKLRHVLSKYNFGPIAAYYGNWPSIKKSFEVEGLPTTYILSPNGQSIAKLSGHADWMDEDVQRFIKNLIER